MAKCAETADVMSVYQRGIKKSSQCEDTVVMGYEIHHCEPREWGNLLIFLLLQFKKTFKMLKEKAYNIISKKNYIQVQPCKCDTIFF